MASNLKHRKVFIKFLLYIIVLCIGLPYESQQSDAAENIFGTFGPRYEYQDSGFNSIQSVKNEAKPKFVGYYKINSNIRVRNLNKVEYRYDDKQTFTLKNDAIFYTFRIPLWWKGKQSILRVNLNCAWVNTATFNAGAMCSFRVGLLSNYDLLAQAITLGFITSRVNYFAYHHGSIFPPMVDDQT